MSNVTALNSGNARIGYLRAHRPYEPCVHLRPAPEGWGDPEAVVIAHDEPGLSRGAWAVIIVSWLIAFVAIGFTVSNMVSVEPYPHGWSQRP